MIGANTLADHWAFRIASRSSGGISSDSPHGTLHDHGGILLQQVFTAAP